MKTFIKILPFLALLVAFSSCRKENSISDKVAGEYVLDAQDEIIINETKGVITDYPDASVKIESAGDNLITVKLKNILLSNKEFLLAGEVVEGTKASEGAYSFVAEGEDETMSVKASGAINGGNISMNIDYALKYDLVGKWQMGTKDEETPDVYFNLKTDVESINILGTDVKISDFVSLATTYLPQLAAENPISHIEFAENGYFNLYSEDAETMDEINKYFNNKFEYYSDATYISFHIKKSLIEMADKYLSEYGITFLSSLPALNIQISYKLDGSNLNLELNKANTLIYFTMLRTMLPGITYQQLLAFLPEADITEEEFNGYKDTAIKVLDIILNSSTTYALGANLVPKK